MPRAFVKTGPEFAIFPSRGINITNDGLVQLSQGNLAVDPTFSRFDPLGELLFWTLDYPNNPHGWDVSLKTSADDRITIQNTVQNLLTHSFISMFGQVLGPTPPDVTELIGVEPPGAPTVDVRSLAQLGFPPGVYGVAPFWVVADPNSGGGAEVRNSPLRTTAGPRLPAILTGSLTCLAITLPAVIPKGVSGVGVGMTKPGDDWSSGPLYVQAIETVQTGVGQIINLGGPFKTTEKVPVVNETYLGAPRTLPAPSWFFGPGIHDLESMRVRLSYRVLTAQGWSGSQGITDWIDTPSAPRSALWWRPDSFPLGTIDWKAEFQLNSEGDAWHEIAPQRYGVVTPEEQVRESLIQGPDALTKTYGCLYQSDLTTYPTLAAPPKTGDPVATDASGVGAPDLPFSLVLPIAPLGLTQSTALNYEVRINNLSANRKGPPSEPTSVSAPPNSALRILPPAGSSNVSNGNLTEIDPLDGLEMDWEKPTLPTGVVATLHDYMMEVADTSNSASVVEVKRTRKAALDPGKPFSPRFRLGVRPNGATNVRGIAKVMFRQLNAAGTPVASDVELARTDQVGTALPSSAITEVPMGPPGTQSRITLAPTATQYQLVLIHDGSTASGTRNLVSQLSQVQAGEGHASPRVRDLQRAKMPSAPPGSFSAAPVLDDEPVGVAIPGWNYAVGVQAPANPAPRNANIVLAHESFDFGRWNEGWATSATPSDGSATSEIVNYGAIAGLYGWHIRAASTTAASEVHAAWSSIDTGQTQGSGGVEMSVYVNSLPSSGSVSMCGVWAAGGQRLGAITLSSSGALNLVATDKNGVKRSAPLGHTAQVGDVLELIIVGYNSGSGGGVLLGYVYANAGEDAVLADLTDINWSGTPIAQGVAGAYDPTAPGITWEFNIDPVVVVAASLDTLAAYIPGNAVEYFGVPGLDLSQDMFLSGLVQPVTPGVTYCASLYMDTIGCTQPVSPLISVFCDASGKTIQRNGPLVPSLSGTNRWHRYQKSVAAPPNAAYLKVIGSNAADGLVRAMGFQFEPGSYPTPFTSGYGESGVITVPLYLGSPMPLGSAPNPVESKSLVKEILQASAIVTFGAKSGYSVRYRSAPDATGSWSPWQTDLSLVPANTYLEIQVTLTSTDGTETPSLRGIYLDFLRPSPVLTRLDGTEYAGGCTVYDMAPVQAKFNVQERTFADESVGYRTFGTVPKVEIGQMGLECYLEQTALEITAAQGTGLAVFTIEDSDLMERFLVRFFDCDFGKIKTDREKFVPLALASGGSGVWMHNAQVTKVQVLGQSTITRFD